MMASLRQALSERPEISAQGGGAVQERLIDIGELALLDEHVLPLFGLDRRGPPKDDAAVLPITGGPWDLVVTTDPCPNPIVNDVLPDTDPQYNFGWLTVVANLSDIAAMGAFPLGIVVSSEIPADTYLDRAMAYFTGIRDAAARFECPVVGGNVRERDIFLSTGTAFGRVAHGEALTQGGARKGDLVGAIGTPGLFWSAVLASSYGHTFLGAVDLSWDLRTNDAGWSAEEIRQFRLALARPLAQTRSIYDLNAKRLLSAGVDASDGIGESLRKLADRSKVQVTLAESLPVTDAVNKVAIANGIHPENLLMSWGGWEMVVTFDASNEDRVRAVAKAAAQQLTILGEVTSGQTGAVVQRVDGHIAPVNLCGSERFTRGSYMLGGLEEYVQVLRRPFLLAGGSSA